MTMFATEAPPSGPTEFEMVQRLQDIYMAAKDHKAQMANEWKRNYRVTMNRAAPNVPTSPGTRANEVFPTVDSRVGWMTDQEIQFTITPAANPHDPYYRVVQTLAEQLEAILNSVMRTDGWYGQIVTMLWDAAMYGAGFLKATWDANLCDGLGNVALKHTSPWCLYVDPFATSLEDAEYIIEVHTMSAAEIERRYPDVEPWVLDEIMAHGETDQEHLPPNQVGNRQKQGLLIPIDAGQGPTTWGQPGNAKRHTSERRYGINVYECWYQENYTDDIESADPDKGTRRVVLTEWRVSVWAGNRILLDERAQDLFEVNRHPYVRYVDVETGEFWGSALLRDLAPCQQNMNTLLAMGQNNIVFTGNPMMAATKGSGTDRSTIKNQPGQIYDVNSGPTGGKNNDPRWIPPPNLPPALMEFVAFWREEMERIAGLSDAQRGQMASGRATDKQVSATQEAGFIRIRSAVRNLEMTLGKAGELLANMVIYNYDTPRYTAIVGDQGAMTSQRLAAQHFYSPTTDRKTGKITWEPMRFTMTVNAGSSKPTSRSARIQEAVTLKQLKVVDDQFVLEAFRVSHIQDVLARKQKQMQMEAQIAQAQADAKKGGSTERPPSQAPKPGG